MIRKQLSLCLSNSLFRLRSWGRISTFIGLDAVCACSVSVATCHVGSEVQQEIGVVPSSGMLPCLAPRVGLFLQRSRSDSDRPHKDKFGQSEVFISKLWTQQVEHNYTAAQDFGIITGLRILTQ